MRSIGDGFRPNLAMGGGSNRFPLELPHGPGGVTPKLDLVYSTGLGTGPFGMGWALAVPYVEWRRGSPFRPAEPEAFTLSGAEPLVALPDGEWAPEVGDRQQRFRRVGETWECRTPDLLTVTFGADQQSRLAGEVDGVPRVVRWYADTATHPNGVVVGHEYEDVDGEHRLARISWSAFELLFEYEPRPDPVTSHALGFPVPLLSRCRRILLRHSVSGSPTDGRAWELSYTEAPGNAASLLSAITVVGWHEQDGALVESRRAPARFEYSRFDPTGQSLRRLPGSTVPPPLLGGDVTLVDHLGTALPGVLQLSRTGATYWENRGAGFGPPQSLRRLPGGVSLAEDRVRFTDLTGSGTADLLVGDPVGGVWFEHDPAEGFATRRQVRLAPGFGLDDERTTFLDLDGDGIVDLLAFRDGTPFGFVNDGRGESWTGPFVLPWGDLPSRTDRDPRLRFTDMTGDGLPDVVLLRSRGVQYWPNVGGGRLGAPVFVADTPAFDVPDPDIDVLLTDVDGDGTADLVLVGAGEVRIHLNCGGRRFGPAIRIGRTPPLSAARVLVADMAGSGSPGLLWTLSPGSDGTAGYLYLDLVGGTKPYLMTAIDNGAGLRTEIRYTTSARERAHDLAEGRRWTGYLPFPVHVVASVTVADAVTGQSSTTTYRYHDGQYDGRTRQWLGFAQVDADDAVTAFEAASRQRFWFHNQVASAGVPAFEAGRGQPRRSEVIDPATGELCSVSTSRWAALPADPAAPEAGAWIAVEAERTSTRLHAGTPYAVERMTYEHDEIGNVVREVRTGSWSDDEGDHTDELVIERDYGVSLSAGATSFTSRQRRFGAAGQLIDGTDWFYDGPAFVGLPHGQVTTGRISRQTEIVLTPQQRLAAYGDDGPALLDDLYRVEDDPDLGRLHVADTRRYRRDVHGNEVETLDALGHRVELEYDPAGLTPVAATESGRPPRALAFDPVVQQAVLVEDPNGHQVRTRFDGLGDVLAVWRRDARPDRPTELYEYDRTTVPHRTVQRVRVRRDDPVPGWERHSHLDGAGRAYQVRTRTPLGWAVERTKVVSPRNHDVLVLDCWDATSPDFDPVPPGGVARHAKHYDFAGRLVYERLFSGAQARHVYRGAEVDFYDPQATAALALDPTTVPSRISRSDAWDRVVAVLEPDGPVVHVERRRYTANGEVLAIVDAAGHEALRSLFDGLGNRIRIDSLDAGTTTFVYNADKHEVLRTDQVAVVHQEYDAEGRLVRVRSGGPSGPVLETRTYDTGAGHNLVGRLARVESPSGRVDYSYDREGNRTSVRRTFAGTSTVFDVAFTYDTQNLVRSVTYPDGHLVAYDYDDTGQLTSISGVVDAVEYGAHGKRTRIRYANGLEARRAYTPGDHLLRELEVSVAEARPGGHAVGTKLQHLVYDLDEVGRVLAAHDQSTVTGKVRNNQTFGYDARNRLSAAMGTGPGGTTWSVSYTYDAAGNLVDGERFTGMVHGADPARANRLVRSGSATRTEYEYDAAGNLTRDPELGTLEYDVRHRLVRVTRPNGDLVEYEYDHHDRRVVTRITSGGTTRTRFEVEGIFVVDDAGSTKVVFDEDRRLALIPLTGDGLLHHLDRLGNVNVISNLNTGAFTGGNEYTPFGVLSSSVVLQPHFAFRGALLTDGLDLVLLGARWYSPSLGRFLTPDRYLLVHQKRIPGLHSAVHLYLYALNNPANFSDPTGRLAFLAVLLIAVVVGAVIGAIAAAVNGVQTWDEFLLWVIGGAIGGALAVIAWGGLIVGVAALFGASIAFTAAATAGLIIFAAAGLLGALVTPALDDSDSPVAWFFSFLIKWVQSPLTTTVGLIAALVVLIAGGNVDFRRGTLFIEVGPGGGALTLGAVVWTQTGRFNPDGTIPDDLARHEAVHSRQVAAMGELGFYFTYVTIGAIWGVAEGGMWNDLNPMTGCGNPFEKTAHTHTGDPATAVPTGNC